MNDEIFKTPVLKSIICNLVKFKNKNGTLVKCLGSVVFKRSLDPNLFIGRCSRCDYVHLKNQGDTNGKTGQ